MKKFRVLSITLIFALLLSSMLFNTNLTQASTEKLIPSWDPYVDDDGDGLLNGWEVNGYDINGDGNVDLDLPAMGAKKDHKDIFVEIDFMEFHRPYQAVLDNLTRAFNNAPVTNPDTIDGIRLHLLIDEQIPHQDTTDATDLFDYKRIHLGSPIDRTDINRDNIINAKEKIIHYALFAHAQPFTTSSGESPNMPGNEFMVTLGAPKWKADPVTGHNVGSIDQQEGTFMHELGHNLGLDHGGWNNINCKPNYLSVMNYAFQMSSLVGDRPLDYSRSVLNLLDENHLSEPAGIVESDPPGLSTVYGPPPIQTTTTSIPIDWDRISPPTNINVRSDINHIPGEGCLRSSGENLAGYNDWANLEYKVSSNTSNLTMTSHSDITFEGIVEHRVLLWESIKNASYPVDPQYFNFSNPTEFGNYNLINTILNDTHNNVTDLLINSNLQTAIDQIKELKVLYSITNSTNTISDMSNLIRVLEKQ